MRNWDVTIVAAIFSGIILVIGSIVTGTVTVIKAIRDTSKKVDNVQTINYEQIDQLRDIKLVVNGRYEEVIKKLANMRHELADVKQALANSTGFKSDQDNADMARNLANVKDKTESE